MSEGEPPGGEPAPLQPPVSHSQGGLGRSSANTPGFYLDEPQAPAPPAAPPLPQTPLPQTPGPWPRALAPAPPPLPSPPRPSRAATLGTLAVVLVVVAAVAVGTALARQADTRLTSAPTARRSAPTGPTATGTGSVSPSGTGSSVAGASASSAMTATQIDFSTRRGAGRLRLLDHDWTQLSTPAATTRLRIRLELVCTGGAVEYGPGYFSVFDGEGRLVEPTPADAGAGPLPVGRLRPGEQVRGWLAFDLPRGAVTLVMGDATSSVTALRLPA